LQVLNLARNGLRNMPRALGAATALRTLGLENNRLSLSVPDLEDTLGCMPQLTLLVWGPHLRASAQPGGMEAVDAYMARQLAHVHVKYASGDDDSTAEEEDGQEEEEDEQEEAEELPDED
jgi:hypothetical protein